MALISFFLKVVPTVTEANDFTNPVRISDYKDENQKVTGLTHILNMIITKVLL
jgi:hypothetical protein